jgi:hypothetical protein
MGNMSDLACRSREGRGRSASQFDMRTCDRCSPKKDGKNGLSRVMGFCRNRDEALRVPMFEIVECLPPQAGRREYGYDQAMASGEMILMTAVTRCETSTGGLHNQQSSTLCLSSLPNRCTNDSIRHFKGGLQRERS